MNGYSVEQRVRIIQFYYQNQCSVSETFRALLDFYPRILRRDLGLHPYEIQLTQGLKVNDHTQRRVFADWVLGQLAVDPNFAKKIIFSDEAHFWMNGYVNKQNCRIWDDTNPHKTQKNKMHPEEITVWCGFWSGGIIGPYFFQNETGIAITVNGERYRSMINNFFWPKLYDMDTEDMWFQQDGATCHTARATMDILRERFEGMVISRNGDINWPPRSCDLTPLDFFLWGYLKSHVHANKPTINLCPQSQHNQHHQANSTRFMQQSDRKLDHPNTCHQSKPRRTFERCYIP
ncbi:unnamed protein product [Macrosiphum euphorbiae]|nr:unnamed protein product [Macrosiphum euphorbiae]